MDIGEVVHRSGLPASTLRYYEERMLIKPVGRKGLRRIYAADVLQRLALIVLGRNAGFTLDEIATMFTPHGPKIDRRQLASKADELDRTIRQLTAMRDGLRHASRCPAPSHLECSKFQRLLRHSLKARR
ncbi:MAG: helix-turn-helix domain-containing protein [Anderseniella sp.]